MDLNYDIYGGQSQPVEDIVLIAYAEQYFADYMNTQVEIDGQTYDFLPYLLSILDVESGKNLYAASEVDSDGDGIYEASFGLFQINWETESGTLAHADLILTKMIRDGVISQGEKTNYLKNVKNLSTEQLNKVVQFMSNIDIQFELGSEIYKGRKNRTINNGDFEDWGARLSPETVNQYDKNVNSATTILAQPPADRVAARNKFNQSPIQFKDSLATDAFDDPDATQAPVASADTGTIPIDEQLLWLYQTTVLPLVDPTMGADDFNLGQFNDEYYNGALTRDDINDLINTGQPPSKNVNTNAVLGQYSRQAGNSSYRNPFLMSSQLNEPTLANAILGEIYSLYKKAANANGILDADYMVTAYLSPLFPNMLRGINSYLDSNGNLLPNYTIRDVVKDVSNLAARDWKFGRLPDYANPEELYDKNQLKNTATSLVTQLLLDDNPNFVNKVTQDYINYKIANPTGRVDFNSYAYNSIKNTARYKTIYKNKPLAMTEEQYISNYTSATQIASPADQNKIIAGQAQAGGTAETAGVAAMMSESGSRSNQFINGIEQSAENLSKLFRKAT